MPKRSESGEGYGFDLYADDGWTYPDNRKNRAPSEGRNARRPENRTAPKTSRPSYAERQNPPRKAVGVASAGGRADVRRVPVKEYDGTVDIYSRPTGAKNGVSGAQRRPILSDRQRIIYEKAYYEKYGRSPYIENRTRDPRTPGNSGIGAVHPSRPENAVRNTAPAAQKSPRQDRRQAFLQDERERKLREAEERKRLEEERLKAQAKEARLAAAREAKRKKELEREYEKKLRERENLQRYETEKRKYERELEREEKARRAAREAMLEKQRTRRHRIRSARFHLIIAALAFVIAAGLTVFFGYRYFYTDGSDMSRGVKYYYDGEKIADAGRDTAYLDGGMRLDFELFASRMGFHTVGDKTSIKFIVSSEDFNPSDCEYIEFFLDSTTAVVNGVPVNLSSPTRYSGASLWVSCDVAGFFDGGVEIIAKDPGKVEINRIRVLDEEGEVLTDDDGNEILEDITLFYRPMSSARQVDLVALYGEKAKGMGVGSDVAFSTDLSAYEEYMNPAVSNEYIVLVNKDNPLEPSYVPEDLTSVADPGTGYIGAVRMRLFAAKSLEAMFAELREAGFADVTASDAYRSYDEQSQIFNSDVYSEMAAKGCGEDEARAAVMAYESPPGESDYQTGLAVSVHTAGGKSSDFANDPAYAWLVENSWKFGFILRYPADKTQITGHSFEPWHFRYVGRYAAEKTVKNGLCLEEYLLTNIGKR